MLKTPSKNNLDRKFFLIWILENWKISSGESAGNRYSFEKHHYLTAIATDTHYKKIVRKSAQCGISELEVAEMIFLEDTRRGNALYVFPAQPQMSDFVNGRVKPAIENNPYLRQKVGSVYNTGHIQFNRNNMYFRGAMRRSQMISVDASFLFLDELDEIVSSSGDQDPIDIFEKRLGAATEKYIRAFSTPTFPEYGIDSEYQNSDMRSYFIKCDGCGHRQSLSWDDNVIVSDGEPKVVCSVCHNDIDRLKKGEWVAANPGREAHGYHISKLYSPFSNINELYKNSLNPLKEQEFYNSDLGLPYQPKGYTLSDEILDSIRQNYLMSDTSNRSTTMGVDVGRVLHVRISEKISDFKRKLIWAGETSWDGLESIMDRYSVRMCVIDNNPESTKAKEFQDKFRGRVVRAFYPNNMKDLFVQPNRETVNINRTEAMTRVAEGFLNGNNILPMNIRDVNGYYGMIKAPIKAQKFDSQGNLITFYPKTGKADHFYHAEVYDLIAAELLPKSVIFIPKGLF